MADPDTSSAEWIAEAPSVCGAWYYHCSEQSLTSLGTVAYSSATPRATATPARSRRLLDV